MTEQQVDLFGVPVPDPIEPPPGSRSPKARKRRSDTVRDRIAVDRHPLTNGPLHPDAPRGRTVDDGPGDPFTCGTCVHRGSVGHHTRSYPKCLIPTPGVPLEPPPEAIHDPDHTEAEKRAQQRAYWSWRALRYPRVSHSDATDCRAWWPACPAYEPKPEPEETPDD